MSSNTYTPGRGTGTWTCSRLWTKKGCSAKYRVWGYYGGKVSIFIIPVLDQVSRITQLYLT